MVQAQSSKGEAFWREQFEKFKVSRISRDAYCREHGLVAHQMAYWQGRIKDLDSAAKKTSPAKLFAKVKTDSAMSSALRTHTATVPAMRLSVGGAITMDFSSGTDAVWIAALVKTLRTEVAL